MKTNQMMKIQIGSFGSRLCKFLQRSKISNQEIKIKIGGLS